MIDLTYGHGSLRRLFEYGGVRYRVQAHASVGDALNYAEQRKAWPRHICSSLRADSPEFHGTPDWDAALKLAQIGWPEGREMLRKACAVMPKAAYREPLRRWDVAGAYPDAARAAAGATDCMVDDSPDDLQPSLAVRVVVSMATPWTTSLQEFVNRGAAVLSAVEAAEAAGHRVEVVAEETAISHVDGVSLSVLLKAAGRPVDRDSLSFFLIHPSALRRIFFALLETEPSLEHFSSGYGYPASQPSDLRPPKSIYLPNFGTGEYADPTEALCRVKVAFAKAGCAVHFEE